MTIEPDHQRSHSEPPPPIQPQASPLWPQHLIDVFIRPRQFFSGQLALGKTPYVLFVTWCYGIANVIDRLDQKMMRSEFGGARSGWEQLGPMITESWLMYWAWVLVFGAISGVFLWLVGGWWYRVRLQWSGARAPDKQLARLVFVYAAFVHAGPTVALTLGYTMAYANYAQAYAAEEFYSLLMLVFPFWSLVTSYIGTRTMFAVSRWKARIWFVILPGALYILVFGLLAAIFILFGQ